MLSKNLAQTIVDKMIEIIKYNVNIMDNKGIIIGSGDKDRIGTIHLGAVEALNVKDIIEVTVAKDQMKPGVNIPIRFNDRIIGVIGITGDTENVRAFGEIVKVTAELLINQEYSIQKYIIKNKLKEDFLFEWLYRKDCYDTDFIERGKSIYIDVKTKRSIVVIEYNKEFGEDIRKYIQLHLKEDDYIININLNRLVVILKDDIAKVEKLVRNIDLEFSDSINRVIISNDNDILANNYYQALEVLSTVNKLEFDDVVVNTKDNIFLSKLVSVVNIDENKDIIEKINNCSSELIKTFLCFIGNNQEKNKTADELHIHRNTLGYRIDKIQEITGLRFDNSLDLYRLMSAYLYHKLL